MPFKSISYKISVEQRLTKLQDGQENLTAMLAKHIMGEDDLLSELKNKVDKFYWVFVGMMTSFILLLMGLVANLLIK